MRPMLFGIVVALGAQHAPLFAQAPTPSSAECLTPTMQLVENIASGMHYDGGRNLGVAGAVKSGSHANAFFVAARIDEPGLDGDIAVWATTSLEGDGLIFSVNDLAKEFSAFPDGGRTEVTFSMSDLGASQSRECVR